MINIDEIVRMIRPHIICSDWVDMRDVPHAFYDVETEKHINVSGVNADVCVVILPYVVAMRLFPVLKGGWVKYHDKNYCHHPAITSEEEKSKAMEMQIENSILNVADAIQRDLERYERHV